MSPLYIFTSFHTFHREGASVVSLQETGTSSAPDMTLETWGTKFSKKHIWELSLFCWTQRGSNLMELHFIHLPCLSYGLYRNSTNKPSLTHLDMVQNLPLNSVANWEECEKMLRQRVQQPRFGVKPTVAMFGRWRVSISTVWWITRDLTSPWCLTKLPAA